MIQRAMLAAILLISGCRAMTDPAPTIPPRTPGPATARPVADSESAAGHIAPVVTRLLATAEADGIQFSVIFKHRFPGDRPVYEPADLTPLPDARLGSRPNPA
jgi:hypothetical protein